MRWRRRPRESFVTDFFRHTFRARTGLFSRPGRDRQNPGDVHGIHFVPFAVLLSPAGDGAFRRLAPTCRFSTRRREFHRRGVHRLCRRTIGLWPRLLGFGPADEPCRVICRPRYSFCAQGRSNPPADTALGFSLLSGVRRVGLRRAILWRALASMGFAFDLAAGLQCSSRGSLVPFGVVRDRSAS